MHEFRIHLETDEDGSSWWCEDGYGFVAVADSMPELEALIREWVDDEGIGEFKMVMPDRQAEVASL